MQSIDDHDNVGETRRWQFKSGSAEQTQCKVMYTCKIKATNTGDTYTNGCPKNDGHVIDYLDIALQSTCL